MDKGGRRGSKSQKICGRHLSIDPPAQVRTAHPAALPQLEDARGLRGGMRHGARGAVPRLLPRRGRAVVRGERRGRRLQEVVAGHGRHLLRTLPRVTLALRSRMGGVSLIKYRI